ncbi:MAG: hypothetical protein ACOYJY_03385 [Acutalibacteraceae bacterium]|jgi:hypothetical protein
MKKRYDPPKSQWKTIEFEDVLATSGLGTGNAGMDNSNEPGEDWND